jgi:hypothetical protein
VSHKPSLPGNNSRNQVPAVDYFYTATSHRFRGAPVVYFYSAPVVYFYSALDTLHWVHLMIGAGLLLVAVICLYKKKNDGKVEALA